MTNPATPELFVGQNVDGSSLSALLEASHIGLRRTNALAETCSRAGTPTTALTLTSGQTFYSAVNLFKGQIVTSLTVFVIGAAVTPTHGFAGLADSAGNKLAQATDITSAAWGANAELTFTLSAPYTVPADGIYYIAVSSSAGTAPTVASVSGTAALNLLAPSVAFNDATAVTGTMSATATKSAGSSVVYAYAS